MLFRSLFPKIIEGYFGDSILKRAICDEKIYLDFINPRDFSLSKHKKVDDYKVGGGAGLLMASQPLHDALEFVKSRNQNAYFLFPVPVGKPFLQHDSKRLSLKDEIVFVCGRYEGIDERVVEEFADELFSIGDYVLTGGELPSMVMCDAISRHVDGVLGNSESLIEESFEDGLLEAPSFTKPNVFKEKNVPSEFLKGNHCKISGLKKVMAIAKTKFYRPDLYINQKISSIKKDY